MIFRMIFLWMVATATARANGESDPDFIMEHPEDPKLSIKEPTLVSLWGFPEIQFLKDEMKWFWWEFDQGPLGHPRRKPTRILASMHCPRELRGVRGPSTVSEEERDQDGDGFRSATWAAWAPGLKQAIKRMVENSLAGATLEKVMKLDGSFLEHLQRDHIPYRRDCRACLAGSFRGHIHRRVVAPDAWCLSLDVIGPMKLGEDELVKKVKYGLIATLAVPDVLGKLLQPPEPTDDDDGGGVGPVLEMESPWQDGDQAEDEAEDLGAAERARGAREEEKWKAAVEKEQVKDVKLVEVPFFFPLTSKASGEVLASTKEILLQVRRLGLVVKRVHTDCGREFVNKGFRALCRDRGFIRTTTGGDNFRSNGRVEALVGRAKNGVRTMLSASTLGSEAWSFAMRHYVARVQWSVVTQLGGRYPRLPPFGTKVFVKQRSWQRVKDEFTEKVVAAKVLCPSLDVAKGFLVKTEDGSYLTTMVAVEHVKETSGVFEVDAPPARADEPGVRRRLRGKTVLAQLEEEMVAKLAPLDQEHLLQDEELAAIFLDAGDYSMNAVEELLEGLWLGEQFAPNRRGEVFSGTTRASVHVLGMYRHGGVVGATLLARTRPLLTQFLVEAMKRQMTPGTSFTTISINFNTPMQCHKDSNNQPGQSACLVGCGNYVGGALWCHEPDKDVRDNVDWHKVDGRWLPGHRHPTYHRAVTFDPCELHQPLPWQGRRITITAYTTGCAVSCNRHHRDLLCDLGFPLPPQQAQADQPEGGDGGVCSERGGGEKVALCAFARCGLGPGENLNSGSGEGAVRAGDLQSLGPGENLKSGSGEGAVRAGDLQSLGPGENLKSGSGEGAVRAGDLQGLGPGENLKSGSGDGRHCKCRGWEVDPSLCVCGLLGGGLSSAEPQYFFIGDENERETSDDAWFRESWAAFGPPSITSLRAVGGNEDASYELVASECPLEVGWDLLEGCLDETRCVLAEEENLERALLDESVQGGRAFEHVEVCKASRLELESELEKWQSYCDELYTDRLCVVEKVEEIGDEAPLHTKTIPNEVVRREVDKWVPSMVSEYESFVRENDAVEPFPEEMLELWKKEGREFDLVPGKTVHTIKAFTGRLKSRAVICGNFLGQTFSKEQKYAAGADSVLIRILLRMVALMGWSLCVMDVRTAFLLAPLLFQEDRPTLVRCFSLVEFARRQSGG